MDLSTFIRGFFGLRQPKRDSCDDCTKSPEYLWPEESFEVRENSSPDDAFFNGRFFNIAPMDPFSVFQQMEDAFRNTFSLHSSRMLDFPRMDEPFNEREDNPRDFLLNPSDGNFCDFFGGELGRGGHHVFPNIESFQQPKSPRDLVLKPSYRDFPKSLQVGSSHQRDSDLDGVHSNEVLQEFPQPSKSDWSFRKSVSTRIIRGSDGTIEEHRTVKDSSGNEVTTVRKSIGDQSYSVTFHKDSEGVNEKKEDFVNLDEKDVPAFQERWHKMKDIFHSPRSDLLQRPDSLVQSPSGDAHYLSIFKKMFGI